MLLYYGIAESLYTRLQVFPYKTLNGLVPVLCNQHKQYGGNGTQFLWKIENTSVYQWKSGVNKTDIRTMDISKIFTPAFVMDIAVVFTSR